jgi:uncharacterized Ntn-hydrolase superfamily protein
VTFSIAARGADCSSWGVAVASKFLAVGAAVPVAEVGAGALATQARANLRYRADGMRLLRAGRSAQETLDALVAADPERAERQAGVVDRDGGAATYTGDGCVSWAGGRRGAGYAIQGNILAGPQVVSAMEGAWLDSSPEAPLPERLQVALAAGDAAGGDRRGRQSAALLVVSPQAGYGGGSDVLADLRVDDAADPVGELRRLLDLHHLYFGRPAAAELLPLDGALAAEVSGRLGALGFTGPDLAAALTSWAGIENLEERLAEGTIDPLVLGKLREATADTRPPQPPPA